MYTRYRELTAFLGAFELCARPKKLVVTDTAEMTANELWRWCAGRVEQQLWDEQDHSSRQEHADENESHPSEKPTTSPAPMQWQASTALVFHPGFATEVIQHAQYCLAHASRQASPDAPPDQTVAEAAIEAGSCNAGADYMKADDAMLNDAMMGDVEAGSLAPDWHRPGEAAAKQTTADRLAAALATCLWPGADEGKVQPAALVERERVVEDGSRGLIWWY